MIAIRYPLVPRRTRREHLTLEAAAARVGLHPVLVERFVEFGLVEPAERTATEVRLDVACLPRLVAITRLRQDLGVNLHGIAVILDLVDRLAALEHELRRVRERDRPMHLS
jgi:DNA-binding transcriptional MerR regulator